MTLIIGPIALPYRIESGWVLVRNGLIADMGSGAAPPDANDDVIDASDALVLPGLVDIHCHGGGGASFDSGQDSARAAAGFHWRDGSTSVIASLGTTTPQKLLDQVRSLAPQVADGTVLGIHLEGPFLSPVRRGAHPEQLLRQPNWDELAEVLRAADSQVAMVTIAPELPGALEVIAELSRAGVIVAVGHTDASFAQTQAAIEAGASVATHLFNGMRPIHHRDGGPVVALMDDDRVACELICDGHHISAEVCQFVYHALGRDRLVLITDAISAAGMPDGHYDLGGESVVMANGAVHTADGRSLAGSALTLIAAVRFVVSCGIPIVDAVRSATLAPAQALGQTDRGRLAPGLRADIAIADPGLHVTRVMRGGQWL